MLQTNVLIKADETAVIADFGLSMIKLDVSSRSTTKLIVGTKRWMSPERMKGRRLASPADIYAWAMTAYEASFLVFHPCLARSYNCIA
jgi:serine/threonine-protein kinase PpkA